MNIPRITVGLCLLLLMVTSGTVQVFAEDRLPVADLFLFGNDSSGSLDFAPNLSPSVPVPSVQDLPFDIQEDILSSGEEERVVQSSPGVAAQDLKSVGEVVMVPITPTPEGAGYSYYNPNGTDPGYLIYSPGTYTLKTDFSTVNSTGIDIRVPQVILQGNGQTISGSNGGSGIHLTSDASHVTITNLSVMDFYHGVDSKGDWTTITNNQIADNTRVGVNASGTNTTLSGNTFTNNSYGVLAWGSDAELTGNTFDYNVNSIYSIPNYAFN